MLQAFIISSRELLEAFLIVAVILAYLRKTGRGDLVSVVYSGILTAILLSIGFGRLMMEVANQSLWEGVLGVVAALLVGSLVIHMWRVGPQMKQQMETKMGRISSQSTPRGVDIGFFLFTTFMMTREGMETALMLFQVKNGRFILGSFLGIGAAAFIAWMWTRFSHLVNLKRFFLITGVFFLVFLIQTMIYAFHELCEAGVFPQSDAWHAATEPYSPDGMYGKWFSFFTVIGIGCWLVVAGMADYFKKKKLK